MPVALPAIGQFALLVGKVGVLHALRQAALSLVINVALGSAKDTDQDGRTWTALGAHVRDSRRGG